VNRHARRDQLLHLQQVCSTSFFEGAEIMKDPTKRKMLLEGLVKILEEIREKNYAGDGAQSWYAPSIAERAANEKLMKILGWKKVDLSQYQSPSWAIGAESHNLLRVKGHGTGFFWTLIDHRVRFIRKKRVKSESLADIDEK
jgi:hypothetical protein